MMFKIRFIGVTPKEGPLTSKDQEGYYSIDLSENKRETIEEILLKFGITLQGISVVKNGDITDLKREVEDGDRLDVFLMHFGG
ncbi:MAG: hypothetical protein QXY90_04530 [Candidatus Anstonellales archaeon]